MTRTSLPKCPFCSTGTLEWMAFEVELPKGEINGKPVQVSYPSTRLACNRCEYVSERERFHD